MSTAPKPPAGTTSFVPARRVRSLDDVFRRLRDAILSGDVAEGERLPNERDLSERFGVGRPTVREALRSLETLGMVDIRPGRTGGAFAVRPSESTLGTALSTLISLRGANARSWPSSVSRSRPRTPGGPPGAPTRRTSPPSRLVADTRRELKAIVGSDWTPLTTADARWHEALARATKNRLRIGISVGLHEPRLRQVPALSGAHARYARTIPTALAKITRAVEAHDPAAARAAMLDHIQQWARLNPDVSDLYLPE